MISSDEFRLKYHHMSPSEVAPYQHLYPGYKEADLVVFDTFASPLIAPQPGFVIDFMGVRTRTSYARSFAGFDGKVLGPPVPSDFYAETVEWLGLLKSARDAKGRYRAMELGAGWDRGLSPAWLRQPISGSPMSVSMVLRRMQAMLPF